MCLPNNIDAVLRIILGFGIETNNNNFITSLKMVFQLQNETAMTLKIYGA
jgi:hypothetical protein